MRIAIVGSGIAGLTCAHVLQRAHDIEVYEAGAHVGGHTNTIDVDDRGRRVPVDTGFIVFNEANYPSFCRLLAQLGVASQPSTMSFSVQSEGEGLEYSGASLGAFLLRRGNLLRPSFLRLLRDLVRFHRIAPAVLEDGAEERPLGAWLRESGLSAGFARHYLVPLLASIWSAPPGRLMDFPARFLIGFLHNHGMLQLFGRPRWRTIRGGSRTYVEALIRPFRERVRVSTPVLSIRRTSAGVRLRLPDGREEAFDEVVVATHADQALRLVADADAHERTLLAAFPYQANETVLHTDASLLPRGRRARAAWNYRIPAAEQDAVRVTYDMNVLQSLDTAETYCVTLNETQSIDPHRVLRVFSYEHPSYGLASAAAQARHAEVLRRRRTSYCGAYWGHGFHEDGVRSGLAVCRAFGMELDP